jgi:hypothetical protein
MPDTAQVRTPEAVAVNPAGAAVLDVTATVVVEVHPVEGLVAVRV